AKSLLNEAKTVQKNPKLASLRQLDFSFTRPRFRSESCSIALCRLFACHRQTEGVQCCPGAMAFMSAFAKIFQSACKDPISHQLPAALCGGAVEAGNAWARTVGIICRRTICTSPWCNFRCGEARCEEKLRYDYAKSESSGAFQAVLAHETERLCYTGRGSREGQMIRQERPADY
ncbi:MAG: hypothetical protein UH229_05910, partial [Lachnospiraceae bacterium]|nr:hypothetical protein [Lachnospiraceae bacterium]